MKGIVALVQLYSVFSYIKLEKDRNHIKDYAAFQLTLIPYGLMSVVNIFCGFVTPNYGAVYMVNSTVMEEARSRGWTFDGTVGELCEETQEVCRKKEVTEEVLYVGFQATFTADGSREGMSASLKANDEEKREMKTNLSPKIGGGEITVAESNTGGEGRVEPDFKIFAKGRSGRRSERIFNWSSAWGEATRFVFRAARETFLIRRWYLKDEDPGEEYATSLFSEKKKGQYIVVPPIGNPTYREVGPRFGWTLVLSDLFVLGSLALPHVLTWHLTRYKAPTVVKWNGVVFQAWLVLGQLSPLPGRVTWGYVQSRQRGRLQLDVWYVIIVCSSLVWSLPALVGFYLVGKERYHHSDAGAPYGKSSKKPKVQVPLIDVTRPWLCAESFKQYTAKPNGVIILLRISGLCCPADKA